VGRVEIYKWHRDGVVGLLTLADVGHATDRSRRNWLVPKPGNFMVDFFPSLSRIGKIT